MNTIITTPDADADRIRELLREANTHGETALSSVGSRLSLLCQVGDILEQKRADGGLNGWLALHFTDDDLSSRQARQYLTLSKARRTKKLDLESRKGLTSALSLSGLLPGFDGVQGSKKPVSYITALAKLHQILCGMKPWEWSKEEREQVKGRLKCIVDVWFKL